MTKSLFLHCVLNTLLLVTIIGLKTSIGCAARLAICTQTRKLPVHFGELSCLRMEFTFGFIAPVSLHMQEILLGKIALLRINTRVELTFVPYTRISTEQDPKCLS